MGNESLLRSAVGSFEVDLDASSGLILKGVPCCTQRQTNLNALFQLLSCKLSVDLWCFKSQSVQRKQDLNLSATKLQLGSHSAIISTPLQHHAGISTALHIHIAPKIPN